MAGSASAENAKKHNPVEAEVAQKRGASATIGKDDPHPEKATARPSKLSLWVARQVEGDQAASVHPVESQNGKHGELLPVERFFQERHDYLNYFISNGKDAAKDNHVADVDGESQ